MYFLDKQRALVSEVAVWKAPICVTVTVPVFRTQEIIMLCSVQDLIWRSSLAEGHDVDLTTYGDNQHCHEN